MCTGSILVCPAGCGSGRGVSGGASLYYLWQIGAYRIGKRLHQQVRFDLVHHVTFVNYWLPSFLALLPVPFVWGPVGGGESAPKTFTRPSHARADICLNSIRY